jgi:hypothetical protein
MTSDSLRTRHALPGHGAVVCLGAPPCVVSPIRAVGGVVELHEEIVAVLTAA